MSCSVLENCHIIQLASLMANVSFIQQRRWLLFNCFSTVSQKCKWPLCDCLAIINAKACLKIGNRIVGKSEYLLITHKLPEFILRIEAKYSAVV